MEIFPRLIKEKLSHADPCRAGTEGDIRGMFFEQHSLQMKFRPFSGQEVYYRLNLVQQLHNNEVSGRNLCCRARIVVNERNKKKVVH
jgi:hypothetical protein